MKQVQTPRQFTEANEALSARVLQLAQDAVVAQDERHKDDSACNLEQAQQLALLEINLVQTEDGNLIDRETTCCCMAFSSLY
ncbi:hypothetical protein BJV74DRAFT_849824 [Russula compacta]|nr:hypothetical protein BJV74DRAFT_849824 [Russula compacta]